MKIIKYILYAYILFATPAQADLILRLDDGGSATTVTDNGVGDINPDTGIISYNGTVGNFETYVALGLSAFPSPWRPILDLFSAVSTNGMGGTLAIALTQTDIMAPPLGDLSYLFAVGGTTNGNVAVDLYLDTSNDPFGMGTLLTGLGPYSSIAFSGADSSNPINITGPYSLTILAYVTHNPGNHLLITSFDAYAAVPEPASLALMGLGLVGFGFKRRQQGSTRLAALPC